MLGLESLPYSCWGRAYACWRVVPALLNFFSFFCRQPGRPPEFRAHNGCGGGHIQTFRCETSGRKIGNVKAAIDKATHFRADAVSFVAHYDDSGLREWLCVEVFAFKESAIDGSLGRKFRQGCGQRQVVDMYAGECPHGGLDGFGIIDVGCIGGAEYVLDAKPVG